MSKLRQLNVKTAILYDDLEKQLKALHVKQPEFANVFLQFSKVLKHTTQDITDSIAVITENLTKKRGRPPKDNNDEPTPKRKRGRPPKKQAEIEITPKITFKKVGRPPKKPDDDENTTTLNVTPKRRGRPPKQQAEKQNTPLHITPKKRGRPPKKQHDHNLLHDITPDSTPIKTTPAKTPTSVKAKKTPAKTPTSVKAKTTPAKTPTNADLFSPSSK